MSARAGHPSLSRDAEAWLVALADPLGRAPPPKPIAAAELPALIQAVAAHGVVPAACHRLRSLPATAVAADGEAVKAVVAELDRHLIAVAGRTLLLRHHGTRIAAAFAEAGVRGATVKGPVFARKLYPQAATRSFTDIDILVTPDQVETCAAVLAKLGFVAAAENHRPGKPPSEFKFLLPGNDMLLIEVQTDLIHSPNLSRGIRLGFAELLAAGDGDPEDATALLLVAAVHGAAGHQFERLQPAVDVLQAARGAAGPVDAARLKRVADASGATTAVESGLDLAARLFAEPAAAELAATLRPAPWRRLRHGLLTPAVVLRAQGQAGGRDSWRRRALRRLIQASGKAAV